MNFSKPKRIFIVDDDLMLSEALSDYLTREVPHQISLFPTGEECLKHIEEQPDVLVLDYYLNTIEKNAANGMEILKTIKQNYPKINIIMLSSQEAYSIAVKTIQKGAEQYVIKDKDAFQKITALIKDL